MMGFGSGSTAVVGSQPPEFLPVSPQSTRRRGHSNSERDHDHQKSPFTAGVGAVKKTGLRADHPPKFVRHRREQGQRQWRHCTRPSVHRCIGAAKKTTQNLNRMFHCRKRRCWKPVKSVPASDLVHCRIAGLRNATAMPPSPAHPRRIGQLGATPFSGEQLRSLSWQAAGEITAEPP